MELRSECMHCGDKGAEKQFICKPLEMQEGRSADALQGGSTVQAGRCLLSTLRRNLCVTLISKEGYCKTALYVLCTVHQSLHFGRRGLPILIADAVTSRLAGFPCTPSFPPVSRIIFQLLYYLVLLILGLLLQQFQPLLPRLDQSFGLANVEILLGIVGRWWRWFRRRRRRRREGGNLVVELAKAGKESGKRESCFEKGDGLDRDVVDVAKSILTQHDSYAR